MKAMTRRALLAFGAATATTLLVGCDGRGPYEVEGVVAFKYDDGTIQTNKASDWTLCVDDDHGSRWDVPVSEYEYGRREVGQRIKATGTDGNVWMVTAA